MHKKILALFSGGLDSLVSVFLMQKLGFEVIPIFCSTPFFRPSRAVLVAKANDLDLHIVDISKEHLLMLENPKYGYGKNFNPCIDCHGLMFRVLKDLLDTYRAGFIISGEVLNQRPMSQRYDALNAVKKLSNVGDLIIRPLSQKLLSDTLPIRVGWVNKDDLLQINGRSRKEQLRIAEEFGLKEVQNSGGGCLLTDKGYSRRLKELIDHNQLDMKNINFLEVGRHFRLTKEIKMIVNREDNEMEYLHSIIQDEVILKCKNIPGPIGILNSTLPLSMNIIQNAGNILLRYTPKAKNNEVVYYGKQYQLNHEIKCIKCTDEEVDKYRINKR